VPLTGQRQLLLEVLPEGNNDGAHADWVELGVK